MRYLVGLMLLVASAAAPLSVNAQDTDESASPDPTAEEAAQLSEPAPEEPALQLELDEAGVGVAPGTPRTYGGYTLDELKLRKRRSGSLRPPLSSSLAYRCWSLAPPATALSLQLERRSDVTGSESPASL